MIYCVSLVMLKVVEVYDCGVISHLYILIVVKFDKFHTR
jgi:hypothetical protein